MAKSETKYLLQRSKEQAALAGEAGQATAQSMHWQMSVLYLGLAIIELAEDVAERYFAHARRSVSPRL